MHPPAAKDHYLESAVAAAPPARLRLMLIERASEIARWLATDTDPPVDALAEAGQRLRLRDILGELLGGVAAGQTAIATQVSDLYVFLLQHLTRAEQDGDRSKFGQIADVLEIERETWTEVCAASSRNPVAPAARLPGQAPVAARSPVANTSSLNLHA